MNIYVCMYINVQCGESVSTLAESMLVKAAVGTLTSQSGVRQKTMPEELGILVSVFV